MPLLSGTVSVTRYNVTARPAGPPPLDEVAFREIDPASEVRESVGLLPFEPEADYQVGHDRYAFRLRVDKRRPDPTAVRERVRQLVAVELETTGVPFVGPKKRRALRELAEEEILPDTSPRTSIVECVLDGHVLYVGSTAKNTLGQVLTLLRKVGVSADPKTPWLDRGEPQTESDLVEMREPGASVLGCRFLAGLVGDREITFEPESGSVRLRTPEARVTLVGAILSDLIRYTERGVEVLSGKLTTGEVAFRLDGPTWRISGLKVETGRHDHWWELLDERLEGIAAVFERLDAKYEELDPAAQPAPVYRVEPLAASA
ncbi:MAG TPA: hypothetical protein VHQ65_15010 [Thermoanaerobaculia bacterium]|nr:hypothetical protein [Thermoanaerobaculia bacterium]